MWQSNLGLVGVCKIRRVKQGGGVAHRIGCLAHLPEVASGKRVTCNRRTRTVTWDLNPIYTLDESEEEGRCGDGG